MASLKPKKLKVPKQQKAKSAKVLAAAQRGGLAKGSLTADLKQVRKEAKPRAGRPLPKFNS